MTKIFLVLLIMVAVGLGGFFAYDTDSAVPEPSTDSTQNETPVVEQPQGKLMSVEAYVTQNISALSRSRKRWAAHSM